MIILKFRKNEPIIVQVYGQEFDLAKEFEKGKTEFEIFGDKYKIEIVEVKNGGKAKK